MTAHVRDINKPTEIERSLQIIGRDLTAVEMRLSAPQTLTALLAERATVMALAASTNNLNFCVAFNTLEESERATLNAETLAARVQTLIDRCDHATARVEATIAQQIKARIKGSRLEQAASVFTSLYDEKQVQVTWSAMASGKGVEPVLHIKITNPVDKSSFNHTSYHIWAKAETGKTVLLNTGFRGVPPETGWSRCPTDASLLSTLKACLEQDGF